MLGMHREHRGGGAGRAIALPPCFDLFFFRAPDDIDNGAQIHDNWRNGDP